MSDTQLNWGKLVAEGKVRAHKINWTPEETKEVLIDRTATAEQVRARYEDKSGVIAPKAVPTVKKTPTEEMMENTDKELDVIAEGLGIDVSKCKNKAEKVVLILGVNEDGDKDEEEKK